MLGSLPDTPHAMPLFAILVVVALYDMQPEQVQDIAERIRNTIESMVIPMSVPVAVPQVTVSIGAVVVQPALRRTL